MESSFGKLYVLTTPNLTWKDMKQKWKHIQVPTTNNNYIQFFMLPLQSL